VTRPNFMKWLTILFTLFIILIIFLANTGNLGILAILYRVPFADKVGHFILYGILVLLINLTLFRAIPSQNRNWIALLSGLTLAVDTCPPDRTRRAVPAQLF
jgi:hypothetical protein